MKIQGKALLAGCIALAMSHTVFAKEIKVAVVGAMSGPVAQYGDQEFTGAKQAIADINARGGIKGDKLVAVEYDDACDPKQAVAVANKVVNDGIKYVIGHLCSSSTQPASDIYEDEGILMITPAATAPELTARGYSLILRTTGLDSDQGPTAAKYILDHVKPQRIAVIHDKQQYGEGLARSVQDNLKKGGANVVFFDGITAGEKDFSTLVARLKKENIDFVYYGGYHPEMGQILRQSRAAGLKTQFMGPEGVANVSLSNIAGASAQGMLVTKPKNYDQVPANKPVVDAIKAKKQDPSGAFVWTTYAALQSLAAGLEKAPDQQPEAVAKYLKGTSVDTVMGPLSWNDKGDLKGFEFGVFTWNANGTSSEAK
ncbi:branched-chain amino acid ABC transporter substrate-binding protein [Shimwellia blattae]|uniref:Leu/Ile/Val-binding protein n=1 Tax=Shimwellia blattae (strain ATCC 29907 / DSM 4481 / JCM 1650 / NBRC 105725 / CDC 9005-74) TaxID=630626 RepID=I2B468_SHIBC|nr:branched-chain amino acid ABC transporter substrate-binding protein [Shimwellia blattae]AFJ45322.1 Leu/Ile/Val-binding protein precursor [Shimwellia blattae DSM 4481 = NBRC 105725]GAB80565.1 branched-chain amino acid ABC transporter substrate-binding periplasmic protein [Shimwellia blattae DSM 4481 = NBRC 105725]